MPVATATGKSITAPVIALSASIFFPFLLGVSVLGRFLSAALLNLLRTSNLWLGSLLAIATATLATRFAR